MKMVPERRFGMVVLANLTGAKLTRTVDQALQEVVPPATGKTGP